MFPWGFPYDFPGFPRGIRDFPVQGLLWRLPRGGLPTGRLHGDRGDAGAAPERGALVVTKKKGNLNGKKW